MAQGKTGYTVEGVNDVLTLAGYTIQGIVPISHGTQLRCEGGGVVNVYSTGRALAQGKGSDQIAAVLDREPTEPSTAISADPDQNTIEDDHYRTTPAMIEAMLASFPAGPWDTVCKKRHPDWQDTHWDKNAVPF